MAGERKKPTAADKGKAVMVVEEKKRDKGIEAALNAVRAPERRRPGGIVIHDPPATAEESPVVPRRSERNRTAPTATGMDARGTPGSRKRARDDDVVPGLMATPDIGLLTALPSPPIVDGGDYHEMFSKASRSVVTVAFHKAVGQSTVTIYRTGFILIDEENYSLVLTTSKPRMTGKVENFFIYFGGEKSRTKAYEIETIPEENLLILIVQTDKRHGAVHLSSDPLAYEVIFTVCAMSGRKLNDKANAPVIKELEGKLGLYKGTVGTPSCYALDASGKHIVGSENYFQLGFSVHDDIITLENVDDEKHTVEIAVSAPVFRLNGQTAGMIFSDGGWIDSKIGLLATRIISCLKAMFGSDEWELELKKEANKWLEKFGWRK